MSKWIDAEWLKKTLKITDDCYNCENCEYDFFCSMGGEFVNACEAISDAPSIDIVRCKECKYWNSETNGCKRNPSVEAWRADDSCSYGERESE